MIRLLISVVLALAVVTSAEAMSPAPLHQPDGMTTQARQARQLPPCAWNVPNQWSTGSRPALRLQADSRLQTRGATRYLGDGPNRGRDSPT
jgi:hypothetical protein